MATDSERDELIKRLEHIRDLCLKRIEDTAPTLSGKDAAIVAGIAADKLALLRGGE